MFNDFINSRLASLIEAPVLNSLLGMINELVPCVEKMAAILATFRIMFQSFRQFRIEFVMTFQRLTIDFTIFFRDTFNNEDIY